MSTLTVTNIKVNGLKTTMPRKKRSVRTAAVEEPTPLERLQKSVVCYGWCNPDQLVSILLLRDIRTYVVECISQMVLTEGWLHVSISTNLYSVTHVPHRINNALP